MKSCVKHPRAQDSSDVLTEARTVLMRAETALRLVEHQMKEGQRYNYSIRGYESVDADSGRIRAALVEVIAELDHWRKCRSDCEGRK